ncbi:cytochrome P450 [Sphingorhabdus arenilitoris]|uniref:Cytochrome P450 n=1 Tax=Sphingorhabdus arenilitoris TaxID=1490041 RepID=A0ABV8RJ27_9SPHN
MATAPPPASRRTAPGPKGGLLWGNLHAFQADATGFLMETASRYGDISRMRFGPFRAYLLNSPEYIHHVLAKNASNYDKKTRSVAQIKETCGDSLLSANKPAWQRQRRLIQPVFQPKYLETILPAIDVELDLMLDRWRQCEREGRPVNIVAEMLHLMIRAAAKMLFSSSVDARRIEDALAIILDDTWRRLQAPVDPSFISPHFHRRSFKRAKAEIDSVILAILRERRDSGGNQDDLLARLLTAHEAEGDMRLSDAELRDAAVTLLLAGHETTANALSWAFYLIARSAPGIAAPYSPAQIFAETLRLYPSIWIMERRAVGPDHIGGYHIERGSMMLMSPYVLHRHPHLWDRPDEFDPGRFHDDGSDKGAKGRYIPFGIGKHKCVGLHMANMVAHRVIQSVTQLFQLKLCDGQTITAEPGITLQHKHPLLVTLTAH